MDRSPNPNRRQLIRLKPILDIIETALWTGRVADARPVSLILIASQESAKTEALKFFHGTPTARYYSDLTTRPLQQMKTAVESGQLRHIVLLDLIKIVSHYKSVTDSTVMTLSAMMEEGLSAQADAGGEILWKGFPSVGMLAALTPEYYKMKRAGWRKTGFLTRFLPVHFQYVDHSVTIIHRRISEGLGNPEPHPIDMPMTSRNVTIGEDLSQRIETAAISWGQKNDTYGFRHHKKLRAMAMARAAMSDRAHVEESDVDKVLSWSDFFSADIPASI